jgi:hypothetical protein
VVEDQVIGDSPAIVPGVGFRARVAPESDQPGTNRTVKEIILRGLRPWKETKPRDGENKEADTSAAEHNAPNRNVVLKGYAEAPEHKLPPLRRELE